MKKYDDIVVGSGISGMTMALILGMNGRRVLLLEKNPRIGGSVARFYKEGIPFDTGFHFTGGLQKDGILYDILSVLEIRDLIQPVFLSADHANRLIFESENRQYEFPYGIENIKKKLKKYFRDEASAVDSYFDKVEYVCAQTPSMNLRTLASRHRFIDEDFISLEEMLGRLTRNHVLKAVLSGGSMCYGVRPEEISFADHSRICLGFYEAVAHVKGGGGAFINAFEKKFGDFDIEVSCNEYIADLADINDKRVGRFVLSSGHDVLADNCIFTIHPGEILAILPEKHFSRAFINRVNSFEPSTGFFSVFAAMEPGYEEANFDDTVYSLLPNYDLNQLLDPAYKGTPALLLIKSVEHVRGRDYKTIVALEPSYLRNVKAWENSRTGMRPPEYQDYKKKRIDNIVDRIFLRFPEYKNNLRVLDSASVLTFRDYLNNRDGSAYGIKQKMGQFNLVGQLPLRNLYAAGQSSLLPGVLGAMLSSFIVGSSIVEEERYNKFLLKNLS
jgi:phytoene dehydrogenase-like protein